MTEDVFYVIIGLLICKFLVLTEAYVLEMSISGLFSVTGGRGDDEVEGIVVSTHTFSIIKSFRYFAEV